MGEASPDSVTHGSGYPPPWAAPGPPAHYVSPETDRVTPSREFIEVLDCGEFAAAKQTLVWRGTGQGTLL